MSSKTLEALVIGVVIWIAGASMIVLFGQAALFPSVATLAAFLAAPVTYLITRFHLRGVPTAERTSVAIRFGVIITAVQFPLDALGWLIIFNFGSPLPSQAARDAIILALEIGYFWLLIVPWWIGKRT